MIDLSTVQRLPTPAGAAAARQHGCSSPPRRAAAGRGVLTCILAAAALASGTPTSSLHAQTAVRGSDGGLVAALHDYESTGRAPIIRGGGMIAFPYGHGRPELVCAPLRTCKILLREDETFLARASGDTERWSVGPMAGPGGATIVVVKPLACDVSTDLTLTTDRRIYDLLLRAPRCPSPDEDQNPDLGFTPLVRFYYPDETVVEYEAARRAARAEEAATIPVAAVGADLTRLDFGYRWKRDRGFPWVPLQIFDDGSRTHVLAPESARQHDLPVLFELGPDGSMRIVNYVVQGRNEEYYVVDRVLHRGVLVIGSDRPEHAVRLLIYKPAEDGG